MKRLFTFLFLSAVGLNTYAQVDSVVTLDTNDVFYNLEDGSTTFADRTTWDIAFTVQPIDVSILTNDGQGVELYLGSNAVADWSTLDTSTLSWEVLRNSEDAWDIGSLNISGSTHPDYGWGLYNNVTHELSAYRFYVIKLRDGSYKKLRIDGLTVGGVFSFTHANLDGTGETSETIDKANYSGKNFVGFDLSNGSAVDFEPSSDSWHLMFTKYVAEIQAGPSLAYYPVSGVKLNAGIQVAQREGLPITDGDTTGLNWTSSITEIGYDWKSFNRTTFVYDIQDSLVYFLKMADQSMWSVIFTGYEGSGQGKYLFTKALIVDKQVGTEEVSNSGIKMYPNPSSGIVNISEGAEAIEIFNLTGQLVYSHSLELNAGSLDLSYLPAGNYISIIYVEGKAQRSKLILE